LKLRFHYSTQNAESIIRQASKGITSLAASNTNGNKLKDIHPTDTNLSKVPCKYYTSEYYD
jgi:hypothetical protein